MEGEVAEADLVEKAEPRLEFTEDRIGDRPLLVGQPSPDLIIEPLPELIDRELGCLGDIEAADPDPERLGSELTSITIWATPRTLVLAEIDSDILPVPPPLPRPEKWDRTPEPLRPLEEDRPRLLRQLLPWQIGLDPGLPSKVEEA